MKTTLFATTAIALGIAAAPAAFAAEAPTATVRGYVGAGVFYGDLGPTSTNPSPDDGFGVLHDGEVHFRFSGSSDNGLTFSGEIEMEAFDTNDDIDEYWTKVSGSFGEIMIGGDDTAYYNTSFGTQGAPLYKLGYFDNFGFANTAYFGYDYASDALGIHYYTPTISGFSAGISYHPTGLDNPGNGVTPSYQADSTVGGNVISVGGSYRGEFDGFSFGIGAAFETAEKGAGADQDAWRVDGSLGYAGVTFTALYEDNKEANGGGADLALGLSYATGPWTIGVGWSQNFDVAKADEGDFVAGWVNYAVSPGVTATAGFEWSQGDANNSGSKDESLVGGTYLTIVF